MLQRPFLIIGLLVVLLISATPLIAAGQESQLKCIDYSQGKGKLGLPIVPCGQKFMFDEQGNEIELNCPCQTCHIFQLGSNVIRFATLALTPALAALFILIGGFFVLTAGPNPAHRQKGIAIILTTLKGVVIVYTAWLIINTALNFFINPKAISGGSFPRLWNQVECPIRERDI